jgi:hypothetical protein
MEESVFDSKQRQEIFFFFKIPRLDLRAVYPIQWVLVTFLLGGKTVRT